MKFNVITILVEYQHFVGKSGYQHGFVKQIGEGDFLGSLKAIELIFHNSHKSSACHQYVFTPSHMHLYALCDGIYMNYALDMLFFNIDFHINCEKICTS